MNKIICKISGKEFNSFRGFLNHLRKYKMSSKEYYDLYLKKEAEGVCYCGNETSFVSFKYNEYCSDACANKSTKKKLILNNKFKGEEGVKKLISFTEKRKGIDPNIEKRRKTIETKCEKLGISLFEYYSDHSTRGSMNRTEEEIKLSTEKAMKTKHENGSVGGRSYYKEYDLFGKSIVVQGYEPIVLDYLQENHNDNNLIAGGKPYSVNYYCTESNKFRLYFPDILLKKQKLFVEVKSEYTYNKNKINTHNKMIGCLLEGYSVVLVVLTNKEARNRKLDGYKKLLDWAISSQASNHSPSWVMYDEGSTTIRKGVVSNDTKCRGSEIVTERDIVWSSAKVEAA